MGQRTYAYEQGRLIVGTVDGRVELTGWPASEAFRFPHRGASSVCRPNFRIVVSEDEPGADPALLAFSRSLPPEVARWLAPFASHQWNLLVLLSLSPAAVDLARHNLPLAYFLANNDEFCAQRYTSPPAQLASYRMGWKQAELLEWLGFPATDSVVRLLRKLDPRGLGPADGRMLRNALRAHPGVGPLLAHLARIPRAALGFFISGHLHQWVTPKLLREVLARGDEGEIMKLGGKLVEVVRLAEEMHCLHLLQPFVSLRRIALFERRFRQAVAEYTVWRKEAEQEWRSAGFTCRRKPPEGTADIVRLTTAAEVVEEGLRQHHCAGTMAESVARGKVALYRILRPERATLDLRPEGIGSWRIQQLRGFCNRPVSGDTRAAVEQWLKRHNDLPLRRLHACFDLPADRAPAFDACG